MARNAAAERLNRQQEGRIERIFGGPRPPTLLGVIQMRMVEADPLARCIGIARIDFGFDRMSNGSGSMDGQPI